MDLAGSERQYMPQPWLWVLKGLIGQSGVCEDEGGWRGRLCEGGGGVEWCDDGCVGVWGWSVRFCLG